MWKWLLKRVMSYVIGNDVFGKIQTLVVTVALDDKLTGAQKRDKVLAESKAISNDLASHMLNLAVESAVVLMKEQTTK